MVAYTHYETDARPRRTAEALVARGDSVDFLSLGEESKPSDEWLNGVHLKRLSVSRYRGKNFGRYLASYFQFMVQAFRTISLRHLKKRYDVIYVHTMPDFMVFCSGFAKLLGARVVLDLHDTMPELYQSKFGVGSEHPLIRLLRMEEKFSCKFADHLICVHEPHRKILVQRDAPPQKITTLMNLPDPSVFGKPSATSSTSTSPRIVYHGTIAARLGLDLALQAFQKVLDRYPQARFDIYGSGDFGPTLIAQIAELGLSDRVYFSNRHFNVSEIPDLIRGATLGVIPNRRDPATEIMLPVKLLEYVYLGIPVVAPRLSAIRHYFDESSVAYYEAGDETSLAEAILKLLDHPEDGETLKRNASKFCETYAWNQMKSELYAAVDG